MKKLLIILLIAGCTNKPDFKANRAEFKNGEVIGPDYVHEDTLRVIDGKGLNAAIDLVVTDAEIDSVLRIYCNPYE